MPGSNTPGAVFTAKTLEGETAVISIEGAKGWLGPLVGGFFHPLLVQILDGTDARWYAGRRTRAGIEGPPGRPIFQELAPCDTLLWCEANGVAISAELVAASENRGSPPADASAGSTAEQPRGDDQTSSPADAGNRGSPPLEAALGAPGHVRDAQPPASPVPSLEANRPVASDGANAKPNPEDDPIETTARMLGKATTQIRLVRFLATRERRSADLAEIDRHVYSRHTAQKNNLRNVRRQAEKTRESLAGKGCPLRLHISGGVARLIDAQPVAQ
jgi:hypothetical protein